METRECSKQDPHLPGECNDTSTIGERTQSGI